MPSSFTLWPRRQMTGVTTVKKKFSHKNQRASFPSGNEFLSTEEGMDRPILQTLRKRKCLPFKAIKPQRGPRAQSNDRYLYNATFICSLINVMVSFIADRVCSSLNAKTAKLQRIKRTRGTETKQQHCPLCLSKQEFSSLWFSLCICLAADMSGNCLTFKSTPMNCVHVKRG